MSEYRSKEHRRKLSEAAKRRWADPELRAKQSKMAREWWAENRERMRAERMDAAIRDELAKKYRA